MQKENKKQLIPQSFQQEGPEKTETEQQRQAWVDENRIKAVSSDEGVSDICCWSTHEGKVKIVMVADEHRVDDVEQSDGGGRGPQHLEAGRIHRDHHDAPCNKRPHLNSAAGSMQLDSMCERTMSVNRQGVSNDR